MLQGSQLLQGPLCVPGAQEVRENHPHPSCHLAQALLCSLVPEGLLFLASPWLLLVLLDLVPQGVLGFSGMTPDLEVVQVHLWNLEDQWVLVGLGPRVDLRLQVLQGAHEALVALEIPLVLSGHLFHHSQGSLSVLEVQVGLGDLAVLADHGHLDPLSAGEHPLEGLGAQVILLDHQGPEVPGLQVGPGQEHHPQESFLLFLQGQVVHVALGDLGDLFLQKGLEERFQVFRGLLALLSSQDAPLGPVGPFLENLTFLWLPSDPSNRAGRPGQATQTILLLQEGLVHLAPP